MGEVFAGRYELVDPIGHGGVGAVWRAWDRRRRRYVAAKVLQQSDAHALLRFVREQAMRIDHPHVLAPASWAADDDKVLFTMDLVRGGSLSNLVGDYGPLPPRLVCVLLDQLLAGLTAVHAEGVVHRDIKPANVLLEATGTRTPHVRLSDFGIAMRKGDARLTETNYVVGTPGYFAPEQLVGAEPDFAADLYATGLVALYLLGGRKPDAQAVQDRFLEMGMPPAPMGVPGPLWQVVGTLLQPDPYARFRTATGARKALAAAMELLPEAAPGEEPVEVHDQIGPLPPGFGPEGPAVADRVPSNPVTIDLSGPPAESAAASSAQLPGPPSFPHPAAAHPSTQDPRRTASAAAPESPPAPQSPHPRGERRPRHAAPAVPSPAPGTAPAASPLPEEPPTHAPTRPDSPALPLPAPVSAALNGASPSSADTASTGVPARRTRPGPPAKVAIPMLALALLCFAVGVAALLAS
ncbi:Serine/threonine protein kinase [Actinacidiphila yanglinensis]|uniref:non-specific serine/threonine protein kinase n=1 Tax=Actinacidiphila yanglinensis TaxID=310779 RepID=A0A1H6A5J5_9ACTN|nr:serine/threonine-protein kinase [Actinacidiphila yanglinensis]SEG43642.1 Serine/threonine protein kinase [Actinacidiphila yanglinensis]